MQRIQKLKITAETVKILTDGELRDARGGLATASGCTCDTYCTDSPTCTCPPVQGKGLQAPD